MKDNFSTQSTEYARFRPEYPEQLFSFIYEHCSKFDTAWDCATGNGQIAQRLATRFRQIEATDISENQLDNARLLPNIRYSRQPAESPDFPDASFDLVVVGQAAHWFDLKRFYPQVQRVLKPGGLALLVGYNLLQLEDPRINERVHHLYENVLGDYWDAERRLVETEYRSLPFPFAEIPFPEMAIKTEWTLEQLLGFISSWSALQHYTKQHGRSPVDEVFLAELAALWPKGLLKPVQFPIFGRAGM